MLHVAYFNSKYVTGEGAIKTARRRYKKLLEAGFNVDMHKLNQEDMANFKRLKINPYSQKHQEMNWLIIYDDETGKHVTNETKDISTNDLPYYFRSRRDRRLTLEVALERAYALGC